jgi:hypothetical protein
MRLGAAQAVLWLVLLAGCGRSTAVKPLGGGYDEVLVTFEGMGEPAMTQHKLQYTDARRHSAILWPWVFSGIFLSNGIAVFVGENPEYDLRVFAVKPPEIATDITAQVIGSLAQNAGRDVSQALMAAGLVGGKQTGNGDLEFYCEFSNWAGTNVLNWPGTHILVRWDQISTMMRKVRETGVERTDRKFGVTYLSAEFKLVAGKPAGNLRGGR